MSTLADRQRVEIQRCFDAFDSQFREWHARVEKPQWAMHYTQVHAATALLNGFRESIRAEGAEALDEVEGLVLSAWRVWEAFRSRLSQRQEEMFVAGLQAADEIAWACRKPMVEAFAEAKKTMPVEPPLTLHHGWPFDLPTTKLLLRFQMRLMGGGEGNGVRVLVTEG